MTRRLAAVLLVVLAFQALIVTPAAIAGGCAASITAAAEDCHGNADQTDDGCSCCPDGVAFASCASACAGVAIHAAVAIDLPSLQRATSVPFVQSAAHSHAYTPPDPPPIR